MPSPARLRPETLHRCAADGCAAQIEKQKLMCLEHWKLVPELTQRRINTGYRALRNCASLKNLRAYTLAVEAAVASVRNQGPLL